MGPRDRGAGSKRREAQQDPTATHHPRMRPHPHPPAARPHADPGPSPARGVLRLRGAVQRSGDRTTTGRWRSRACATCPGWPQRGHCKATGAGQPQGRRCVSGSPVLGVSESGRVHDGKQAGDGKRAWLAGYHRVFGSVRRVGAAAPEHEPSRTRRGKRSAAPRGGSLTLPAACRREAVYHPTRYGIVV